MRVVEKQIPDVLCHNDGLLGIVKIQMPEQCDDNGLFFKIRDRDRERNLRIIQNTIAMFGNWAQQVNAPAIILFPELSVSEEATDWLRAEMATARITANTLIVLGMEHLSTNQFSGKQSRIWRHCTQNVSVHYVIQPGGFCFGVPTNPFVPRLDGINRVAESKQSNQLVVAVVEDQESQSPTIAV